MEKGLEGKAGERGYSSTQKATQIFKMKNNAVLDKGDSDEVKWKFDRYIENKIDRT